jgi:hypothetical protein
MTFHGQIEKGIWLMLSFAYCDSDMVKSDYINQTLLSIISDLSKKLLLFLHYSVCRLM